MGNPNAKIGDQTFVKRKYPYAFYSNCMKKVISHNGIGSTVLGENWADAASHIRAEEGIGEAKEVPEKCGKFAGSLNPRLGLSYACVLDKGHEYECQRGGTCFKHGPYVGANCPHWPTCVAEASPELDEAIRKAHAIADEGKPTESAQQEPAETPDILNIGHISYGEFKKACEQHGVEMPPFVVWAAIASIAKIASPSAPVSAQQEDITHTLWYRGGRMRSELNDALVLHPEIWHAEGLQRMLDQWDEIATRYASDTLLAPKCKSVGQEETKR